MAATDEQKAILFVLRLLLIEGEDWTRYHRPATGTVIARAAEGKFAALTAWQLENYLLHRGKTGRFDDSEVIYVKPPTSERTAVAAIWCHWDFDLRLPKCGFYFGIWCDRQGTPPEDRIASARHTAFLGLRYETPEDGDNHNYYHAQPCRSMAASRTPVAEALPIPDRYPAFPLAATSSVDLLLCLVTSIHGMNGLTGLRTNVLNSETMRGNECLRQSLDRMIRLQNTTDPCS